MRRRALPVGDHIEPDLLLPTDVRLDSCILRGVEGPEVLGALLVEQRGVPILVHGVHLGAADPASAGDCRRARTELGRGRLH